MQVISIQDLSCMGKCSLTVALPVLSAMGISTSVLPTAVLSTHTGFPAPQVQPMTENLLPFAEHIASVGGSFDAISTGYLSDPQQAEVVCQVLDKFDCIKVIDPAMGDHGKLYSRMTPDHVEAMKHLCSRGSVLLPNLTEAAFLTGMPYREDGDGAYLKELAQAMCQFGAEGVIITGVSWDEEHTGFYCHHHQQGTYAYRAKRIPKSLHGTGDLFTAVFTGKYLKDQDIYEAAKLAAQFVERVVAATETASPFGAEFEKELPWLMENL
jgi:pyridoxine kinase